MTRQGETTGRLARRFGLSRSTLLYYDRIGLLRPTGRTLSNYRTYTPRDEERLQHICTFRQAGLPLKDIRKLLSPHGDGAADILEKRLAELSAQINQLRHQQRVIVELLKQRARVKRRRIINREEWVSMLRAAGLNDEHMDRWHQEFECTAPEAHQEFLESLGIAAEEITRIRQWSRGETVQDRNRGQHG